MTNKKRIEELERRVKELESRPIVYPPIVILQPEPQPWRPAPVWPQSPDWVKPVWYVDYNSPDWVKPVWYVDYNSLPRC